MINKLKQKLFTPLSLLIGLSMVINACVKYDYDDPYPLKMPLGEVLSIQELRQLFSDNQNQALKFTEDYSVYGVITMDGSSGNIYRNAFLQDATGAINLRLMSPGGLNQGDSIRLYLKGTTLSSFQQMLQVDSVHTGYNVAKLATKVPVKPTLTDIPTLLTDRSFQSMLIKLEGVEFVQEELGQTFADSENLVARNLMLKDCDGNEIIVRTSGYASFADDIIPEGNGTFIGISAQFRSDRQLYIRHLDEIKLDGPRCPAPGDDMEPITIAEIKELESQGVVPAGRRLEGVVISDRANGNTPERNLHLMDENGDGLALRFLNAHDFDLGDQIRVLVGERSITRFLGLLQISDIPNADGIVMGEGQLPDPVQATLKQLTDEVDLYQSTLVKVENVTIPPRPVFEGSIPVTDETGQAVMYTSQWASFATTPVTPGVYNVTAIASHQNGVQLVIRSLDDLEFVDEYDPGDADLISIGDVIAHYNQGGTAIPAGKSVEGVIISDKNHNNTFGRNAFLQGDDGHGIALRFDANHDFNLGDKIRISASELPLEEFNGLLQINHIPTGNAELLATDMEPEPQVTTIENILDNMDVFEATLVRIENVTISGGATFSGELTLNDGTATIAMYTRPDATFSGNQVPDGTVTLTGIVSIHFNPQIVLRNMDDIQQ